MTLKCCVRGCTNTSEPGCTFKKIYRITGSSVDICDDCLCQLRAGKFIMGNSFVRSLEDGLLLRDKQMADMHKANRISPSKEKEMALAVWHLYQAIYQLGPLKHQWAFNHHLEKANNILQENWLGD